MSSRKIESTAHTIVDETPKKKQRREGVDSKPKQKNKQ
jgi:hypothetical protein